MSDVLYERSQSLLTLPFGRRRIVGMNNWRNATDYLYLLFEFDVDWIINVDEDCFVFDNDRILGLLSFMQHNDYDFCGIPDGGACVHRFHNPVVTNPFFNIYNAGRIRPKLREESVFQINRVRYAPELERFTPRHLLKNDHAYAFDDFECYYGFFFWLLLSGFKPLYLPSRELEDGLTTELRDHEDVPFLYHTWFTRKYTRDEEHTRRIDHIFDLARRGVSR
ncbi:MAG: hypothetical protein HZB26_14165 [Candidatus Hydrogenedentes bacterium]|nr:hypothetical protein [Candidatus Hydrogenedentota bacterium]